MALPDESMAGAAARPPLGEQPLGEQPLGELSLNGMPLDDGVLGIMQVETAAVVEMLGGEPGVAQHVAAHVVDDAGCVQMAATVRAASIERVDALDSLSHQRPLEVKLSVALLLPVPVPVPVPLPLPLPPPPPAAATDLVASNVAGWRRE